MIIKKYKNQSATALVKTGAGSISGIMVASGTPTLKVTDGLTGTPAAAVAATDVFTIATALTPGTHAVSILTSDATAPSDGDKVVIGTTTYTAKTALTLGGTNAYEVLIGGSAAVFLDNLKSAINGSAGAGTTYGIGTVAHPDVVATTNTNTQQSIVARVPGTAANTIPTTETSSHLSWPDTTLGGGTGASDPGVAGDTFTINGRTYTFVDTLSETNGAAAIKDQVLWVTSDAVALDNMKAAINATGTPGTEYSTGTVVNADVSATTNTNTAQTIAALVAGTSGNSITATETSAGASWGTATLAGGAAAQQLIINTFQTVAATMYFFGDAIAFGVGLHITQTGAGDITVFYD